MDEQELLQVHGAVSLLTGRVEELAAQIDPARQSNATTRAYVSFLEVKSARTRLFGLTGYNAGAAGFLHLYDASDLPPDGALPAVVLALAADDSFSLDYGFRGRHFLNGLVIAYSTTGPTKTIGAANLWLDVQYD